MFHVFLKSAEFSDVILTIQSETTHQSDRISLKLHRILLARHSVINAYPQFIHSLLFFMNTIILSFSSLIHSSSPFVHPSIHPSIHSLLLFYILFIQTKKIYFSDLFKQNQDEFTIKVHDMDSFFAFITFIYAGSIVPNNTYIYSN